MATIQYAGEYKVDVCEILSVTGAVLDVRDLFSTVSIFEDIFQNSITGSITLVDTNNLLTNLPIIGQEKLRLKLYTPNADDDTSRTAAINFTETPLYIYKIESKTQVNDQTIAYSLGFTTPEAVRNNRIRVSQSYEGEPTEMMVKKILRDEELLDSKKEFYYETTSNNYKFVAPNMRPMDFINAVARRCFSRDYNFAPSFLFYETVKGFWFRTIDSMMDKQVRWSYAEMTPNVLADGAARTDTEANLHNILNYSVVQSVDTMMNMRKGLYGSKLTMIDLINKTTEIFETNYFDDFQKDVHLDQYPLASEALDDKNNKLSDYTETCIYMQSVDRDSPYGLFSPRHEGFFDYTGTDQWLQRRRSRFTSLDAGIVLRIEVPGNTTLQVGDLVQIDLRNTGVLSGDDRRDPYYSGKYLVRKLRHEFTRGQGVYKHTMHMEVVKDAIPIPYPSTGVAMQDGGPSTDIPVPTGSSIAN
jgi:hypothetical protein